MDGLIDLRVAVSEYVGADAHERHVDVLATIEIPHATALGSGKVGWPTLGQKHLDALR